jgi:hypothetical protein
LIGTVTDAGKKNKGKKRHILVDTLGLVLHAIVYPADIQDRDGGIQSRPRSTTALSRIGRANELDFGPSARSGSAKCSFYFLLPLEIL